MLATAFETAPGVQGLAGAQLLRGVRRRTSRQRRARALVPAGAVAALGYRTATGTVYVDSHGLVRRMLTTFTYVVVDGPPVTFAQDVTFSDFGTAVSVTAPPASQVLRTNGDLLLPAPLPARGAKS